MAGDDQWLARAHVSAARMATEGLLIFRLLILNCMFPCQKEIFYTHRLSGCYISTTWYWFDFSLLHLILFPIDLLEKK
jgi:hypothetical protein